MTVFELFKVMFLLIEISKLFAVVLEIDEMLELTGRKEFADLLIDRYWKFEVVNS